MVTKCANPDCENEFHYLGKGKLFLVEMDDHGPVAAGPRLLSNHSRTQRVEHYWLCDDCAAHLTLAIDRERGVVTVPVGTPVVRRAAAG